MRIVTECGHDYDQPWSEGYVRYGPFFYCDVCGSAQAVPVDSVTGSEYIETRNANEYYSEQGWPLVPPTLEEALGKDSDRDAPREGASGA